MTEQDRQDLINVKENLEMIAKVLKNMNDRGFQISFGIDGINGTLPKFEVVQMVPVDIEKKAN